MIISTILPILAVSANQKWIEKNKEQRSVDRFVASDVTEECSNQVPRSGWTFETTNNESSGEIRLNNYSNGIDCKHVVQASCQENFLIKIEYHSIAVETSDYCLYDSFRFEWPGTNGSEVTPPRCHCYGDGCNKAPQFGFDEEAKFASNIGPSSFLVNSNTFTFFFYSDESLHRGHVNFDWKCVETCSNNHSGYEEFGNRVRSGIEQGLDSDINDFSAKTGKVTSVAGRRINQYKKWFLRIFDTWYDDVTGSAQNETRKCLTDNFPYDSPGNLDKLRVLITRTSIAFLIAFYKTR